MLMLSVFISVLKIFVLKIQNLFVEINRQSIQFPAAIIIKFAGSQGCQALSQSG